jgi:adenine-specific DNA methylase
MEGVFRTKSYSPQSDFIENNVWGARYGRGSFVKTWEKLINGITYASAPTDRYIKDGETKETPPFAKPIDQNTTIHRGDMRRIDAENEYDAIITDPPYYDNIIYSEVADYFYVWQKILLEDEYEGFNREKTPRAESIVTNPFLSKTAEDFESELHEAFTTIHNSLKEDGVLTFTYHHSDSESWGELLESLCDVGFEVTATSPISADESKFISGEAVSFDIIIVARPAGERDPISWNSLRRDIYRTAQTTRKRLEENRDLSRGDIGVVEMGRCFHEYSKHHGEVERAGETMTAKEVVDEIYGVIQHGSDIGEIDVFLDLLETPSASYDDLNKLCRGTNATPERMDGSSQLRSQHGFMLGTWDDEKRIAYVQGRVGNDEELTGLDKAQFLRYRWEHGKSVSEYLSEWDVTDDLRELCEGLADATGDDTYRNILESRLNDY